MFIGRERELQLLQEELQKDGASAILIYGRRRVGKTTLIKKAADAFSGKTINMEGIAAKMAVNIKMMADLVADTFEEPSLPFTSFKEIFDYLGTKKEPILFFIDEYPDMSLLEPAQTINSMFRQIVDNLPQNIKLILSGSQVDMMKSLLDSANPLFGRFHIVIKLEDFNYMEAASCYPQAPVYEKVGFYSVFGGLPFIARELDESKSLKENILRLLLPQHGKARMYLENILLNELRKTAFGWGILSIIGNRKATYKDIEDRLGKNTNGLLARQLETMENMELITKVYPINAYGDKKKSFYEIKNNLIRFYFTYIYENKGRLEWVDEGLFYDRYIAPSINTFISYRFEEIVGDYFKLLARKGLRLDIEDVGRYWYNDKEKHQNGEFDCALRTETGYEIYEVKYFSKAMTEKECREEQEQVNSISGLTIRKLGFASVNGFTFSSGQWNLLEGKDLYNVRN